MARTLVIGGYGLIGSAVVRECLRAGHDVVGLGRSLAKGRAAHPDIPWRTIDLRALVSPADFDAVLDDVDVVVNAAGVLQSGGRDDVAATQERAVIALVDACERRGISRFVQISAPNVSLTSSSEFYRTKAAADAHLARSALAYTILRPGLVIAPTAYGGTAVLRMLAATPVAQPLCFGQSPVQTVSVDVVARAVERAIHDPSLVGCTFDLVEDTSRPLRDILLAFRRWLGFAEPRWVIDFGPVIAALTGRVADLAGLFGWRSPLRTTAMTVLSEGVVGDPEPWRRATGEVPGSLHDTLQSLPATAQERQFARSLLVFPVLVLLLSAFWIATAIIALVSRDAAIALVGDDVGTTLAALLLFGGAAADIAIGTALLIRRTFAAGLVASAGLSVVYLIFGSVLTPEIWLDPLGPFVKVLAVIGLSLALLAQSAER